MTKKGQTKYVLMDSDNDITKTFESIEDIEEYLDEEEYNDYDLESVRVFEVAKEYEVTLNSEYEFEEV